MYFKIKKLLLVILFLNILHKIHSFKADNETVKSIESKHVIEKRSAKFFFDVIAKTAKHKDVIMAAIPVASLKLKKVINCMVKSKPDSNDNNNVEKNNHVEKIKTRN